MDLSCLEMLDGARNVLMVSAGIKKGVKLLIITDTKKFSVAEFFIFVAEVKKIDYSVAMMPIRMSGEEPPKPIAMAMKEADIIITLTTESIYHNHATLDARESGARIIAM